MKRFCLRFSCFVLVLACLGNEVSDPVVKSHALCMSKQSLVLS